MTANDPEQSSCWNIIPESVAHTIF